MLTLEWLTLCLWVGSLGLAVGYGCASRRVAVREDYFLAVAFFIVVACIFCTYLGRWTAEYMPIRTLDVMAGLGLIVMGMLIASFSPQYPGHRERGLFAVAIVLAVTISGLKLGVKGGGGISSLLIALILIGGMSGGYLLGQKRISHWRFYHLKPYLAGMFLILLGLIKVF